jgi:iron complex transport system substrate-binding protein
VSIAPAVTEMLFAIGAGPQVVGVSSFDRFPPEVTQLPQVGALLDPDTERILSLRPDLVVLYGSQMDQLARFKTAGIQTYDYRHGDIDTTLQTMRDLGALTGHAEGAARAVNDIRTRLDAIRTRVAGFDRPRTLVVFGRRPGTLQGLYAIGGQGFLHDMLEIAGGTNVFADMARESVQPSHETLLAVAPDVVLELSAEPKSASDIERDRSLWRRLGTIPAVQQNEILFVAGEHLLVPGPRLALSTEAVARALHPEAFR